MGIRRGRRVPTIDPNNQFYYGGMLICLAFGMSLAGIEESYLAGDRIWMWGFIAGNAVMTILYFWNVWCWWKFPNPDDDYAGVEPDVPSPRRSR